MRRAATLLCLILPAQALAQYQPSLAVIGVEPPDPSLAPVAAAAGRALADAASASGSFSEVLAPDEVRARLGAERYTALQRCGSNAICLGKTAAGFDADRLLVAKLTSGELSYDLTTRAVDSVGGAQTPEVELSAMPTQPGLVAAIIETKSKILEAPGAPMGLLSISTDASTGVILVDAVAVGAPPSVDRRLSPGVHVVRIETPGAPPAEQQAKITAGERTVVALRVSVASSAPIEAVTDGPAKGSGSGFLSRPGTWVAAGGVALLAVGLGFGASASSADGKAVDAAGDGALDITRDEAQSAEGAATAANVFFVAGGAAVAGGLAWAIFLQPEDEQAASREPPGDDHAVAPVEAMDPVPLQPLVPADEPASLVPAPPVPAPASAPRAQRSSAAPRLAISPFGLGLAAHGTF